MATSKREVLVHAGFHCTGAEEFQRFLGANREQIAAGGYDLAYPGRGGAAGGAFDCAYPEARHSVDNADFFVGPVASALAASNRGGDSLIVAEHDLAGRMTGLLEGRFYTAARKRAGVLGQALGRPVDRLVVTVKPYDVLFQSAWQRVALEREVEPYSEFVPAMGNFHGGWVEVVEALRDGLQARKVVVLTDHAAPQEVLAHLAPDLKLVDPVMGQPMPQITDSAIAMIQRHFRQGARFAPGQRDRLLAFHAHQPQIARESGFAGLQLADLRGRYVADLASLTRLEGVQVAGGLFPMVAAE